MKKIYSFLASALALATAATASATSVTIIVDNPAAVRIVKGQYTGAGMEYTPIVDPVLEVNEITIAENEYLSAYVQAVDGYAITSVKSDERTEQSSPTLSWYFSVGSYNDGTIYVVETKNLEESRTASFEVTVDDPSKIRLERSGSLGGEVSLVKGTQTIKFDPANETQFAVRENSSSSPVYYIKQNNKQIEKSYGQYYLTVADGDKVDIVTVFPDVDFTVKVLIPEDVKDAFIDLHGSGENALVLNDKAKLAEGVSVHAGTYLSLSLNTTDYAIDAMSINGEKVGSIYWTGVIDQDYTFDIAAHKYGDFDVEINVDDPTRVTVTSEGATLNLSQGVNVVTFKESRYGNTISVTPTAGNLLKGIRIVNGETERTETSGSYVRISKGDKLYITTAPKEPDTKLIVWIDPAVVNSMNDITFYSYTTYENLGTVVPEAGVNIFNYCYVDLPMQMNVNVKHPDPIPENYMPWQPYISYNEGEASASSNKYLSSYDGVADGDIIRLFYEQPEKANVTVTVADALATSAFRVEVDTRAASDWANMLLFKGSGVKIIPVGANIKCTVDGNAVTADTDGNFVFTVTGDHKVALELNTSGIDDIDAEDADAPKVVYNLQGIRMADPGNLPAGIYIINGKKVAVK